jgi:hypothetical protein
MLSTPHKRFIWGRSDRLSELTFFRALLRRRRREQRIAKEGGDGTGTGKYSSDTRWKAAAWTPWLWVK